MDQADENIGRNIGRTSLDIGPIGLIGLLGLIGLGRINRDRFTLLGVTWIIARQTEARQKT